MIAKGPAILLIVSCTVFATIADTKNPAEDSESLEKRQMNHSNPDYYSSYYSNQPDYYSSYYGNHPDYYSSYYSNHPDYYSSYSGNHWDYYSSYYSNHPAYYSSYYSNHPDYYSSYYGNHQNYHSPHYNIYPTVDCPHGSYGINDPAAAPLINCLIQAYYTAKSDFLEAWGLKDMLTNAMANALNSDQVTYYGQHAMQHVKRDAVGELSDSDLEQSKQDDEANIRALLGKLESLE